MDKKKYVVLEHLTLPDRGFRFFSTNGEDNTHSYKGDLWYKEVFFTDSVEEAQKECSRINYEEVASYSELCDYYENEGKISASLGEEC